MVDEPWSANTSPAVDDTDGSLSFGIVGALRFIADEVQMGRVLHAVVRADGVCANAFCTALLDEASKTGNAGRRARARKLLADLGSKPVKSTSERDLFLSKHGVLAKKAQRQGRVDLSFEAGPKWQLGVELKFDDPAKRRQQDRYPAVGRPVIFVVRDPDAFADPLLVAGDAKHYLGAISWKALLPRLHLLPVEESQKSIWDAVLRVSELNGDFKSKPPSRRSTKVDVQCLSRSLPGICRTLGDALTKQHGSGGRRLADALVADKPFPGRTWAWLRFRLDGGVFIDVGLRHAESSQPHVQINWAHVFPRKLRTEYRHLERTDFVREGHWWTWRDTVSPAAWRTDHVEALTHEIAAPINALVCSGVMRVDASED